MTYPLKFRQPILAVREAEGLTLKEASERFCIGEASLSRWIKKIEPQTTRHKPATKLDRDALAQDVKSHPDAYQRERAVRFGVSAACIQFALKRLGITHKKDL
jgi:transposase